MRIFYRVKRSALEEKDIILVEEVLQSTLFIYLDFVLLSILLSYILFPLHGSILISFIISLSFSLSSLAMFHLLQLITNRRERERES